MIIDKKLTSLCVMATLCLLFSGCGEKTVTAQSGITKLETSKTCIECHDNATSPGTAKNIIEEWKLSHHNTLNGAGCADCHEPEAGHPASCNRCHSGTPTGTLDPKNHVSNNPDRDGKCDKCHSKYNGLFPSGSKTAHYNNSAEKDYPASYVSYNYVGNCRKCHNPHDTTSARNHLKDWALSGHGTTNTRPNVNDFIAKAREEYDFKTTGSFTKTAVTALSDNSSGYAEVCVRCHTTTGFINYVKSGFKDISPFGAIDPLTGKPYQIFTTVNGSRVYGKYDSATRSIISSDKSKELTACNACHDNGNEVAYDYKNLRTVPQVTSYYNLEPSNGTQFSGGALTGFGLTFPELGKSNMCIACHSGRMTGVNIKMADVRGVDYSNQKSIIDHFRGAALTIFSPTAKDGKKYGGGFEFYSSNSTKLQDYDNTRYAHKIIGLNQTVTYKDITEGPRGGYSPNDTDKTEYGPCIGCHLNIKDSLKVPQTSHTFLPVNTNASSTYRSGSNPSDPITVMVTKACSNCHEHEDVYGVSTDWDLSDSATGLNKLELERQRFKAALKAFQYLMAFSLDARPYDSAFPKGKKDINGKIISRVYDDGEGKPPTPTNWYGFNKPADPTKDTSIRLQAWLLTDANTFSGAMFTDPLLGQSYPLKTAANTMGAVYNFFMLYYDPGAFAHNRYYVKRLMYDSIDWLDNGKLDKSVCEPSTIKKDSLNSYGTGIVNKDDATDIFQYSKWLNNTEITMAGYYICRTSKLGADHRPNPYK